MSGKQPFFRRKANGWGNIWRYPLYKRWESCYNSLANRCTGGSMDRASDSGSEGWGFESLPVYQTNIIRTRFSELEKGSDYLFILTLMSRYTIVTVCPEKPDKKEAVRFAHTKSGITFAFAAPNKTRAAVLAALFFFSAACARSHCSYSRRPSSVAKKARTSS